MSPAASVRASRRRVSASDEERFVVGLEGVGAERLERVAQLAFGVLIRLQPLGVDGAFFFELGLEAGVLGPRREPADDHARGYADGESDDQRDAEGNGVDGH